jgi:hypothetical protein
MMFFDDARVLHGHVPATEIDHPGTHAPVDLIERSKPQRWGYLAHETLKLTQ